MHVDITHLVASTGKWDVFSLIAPTTSHLTITAHILELMLQLSWSNFKAAPNAQAPNNIPSWSKKPCHHHQRRRNMQLLHIANLPKAKKCRTTLWKREADSVIPHHKEEHQGLKPTSIGGIQCGIAPSSTQDTGCWAHSPKSLCNWGRVNQYSCCCHQRSIHWQLMWLSGRPTL